MPAARSPWPLLIGGDDVGDTRLPGGILVGIGSLAVIVAGFVASALPQADVVLRYGVLVAAVFVFAALCHSRTATTVVAAIGFLVFNGFLVNQLGELTWHGWADVTRVAALGTAAVFGRLCGDVHQSSSNGRRSARRAADEPVAFEGFIKEETHDA